MPKKEVKSTVSTSCAELDMDRERRCGYPEVIYGEGKTVEALREIIQAQHQAGIDVLVTRVSLEKAQALMQTFPEVFYNETGCVLRLANKSSRSEKKTGKVTVITAGTSDAPVAEEACETLRWMGVSVKLIQDVGVAGPHRLMEHLPDFLDSDVVVVVAGMEGALPSVVGGYVPCPVIAVPTSVGYGAGWNGLAALLGMLNSCAANVTVVNIDAGFKGGYVAGMIALRTSHG